MLAFLRPVLLPWSLAGAGWRGPPLLLLLGRRRAGLGLPRALLLRAVGGCTVWLLAVWRLLLPPPGRLLLRFLLLGRWLIRLLLRLLLLVVAVAQQAGQPGHAGALA